MGSIRQSRWRSCCRWWWCSIRRRRHSLWRRGAALAASLEPPQHSAFLDAMRGMAETGDFFLALAPVVRDILLIQLGPRLVALAAALGTNGISSVSTGSIARLSGRGILHDDVAIGLFGCSAHTLHW